MTYPVKCEDCGAAVGEHCVAGCPTWDDAYAYEPMDDIPWGTPDEWVPDNPNEDGFRQSDFI